MSSAQSKSTLLPILTGAALSLGAATQLRLVSGIGPGEILLLIVWLAGLARILADHQAAEPLPLQRNYILLLSIVGTWSWVGLAVSQQLGTTYEGWPRQIVALLLALSFPFIVRRAWGDEFFMRAMGAMAVIGLSLYGLAWLALQFGVVQIGPATVRLFSYRFVGFSTDPNQAAMLISVAMMSAVIVGLRMEWSRWKMAVLVIIAVILGRATDSDSFLVAFGFALLVGLGELMLDRRRELRPGATLLVGVVALTGVGLILYGIYAGFDELYAKNNQGATRFAIWRHGYEAFLAAPFTGHGPGHFSGILAPFLQAEAHNLYIDWAAQFGIVGLIVLVALLVRLGLALLREREFAGLGMLAILAIPSTFLFFGRHAVFWSGVYLCLVLLAKSRKSER